MSGEFLLDTNIVIALFANDPIVIGHLRESDAVFLPSIVLGELYYGAQRSKRSTENVARIEEFAKRNHVVNCDAKTANRYGAVKDKLRRKGRPLPENDIWIAAMAVEMDLPLVTRDAHFMEVENLRIESWATGQLG